MLDKTIEFHSIIMRHPNNIAPILPKLPSGFSVRFYEKGDEQAWTDIQVAVLEFPNHEEALKCYDYYWQYIEDCEMIGREGQSVNVGEAFVYPSYRGTGLAEKLLEFAESRAISAGYRYMWVEHGTANPNARGFWNKYFTTYQYELVRRIG